jgi:hypothetical protein
MNDNKKDFLRATIFGPGGDNPPGTFDPNEIRVIEQWTSLTKYDGAAVREKMDNVTI